MLSVSCSVMSDSVRPYGLCLCDPWTISCQAPLPMRFSRQEYWSGLPFPSPGDLPPGIEPGFPALQADSLLSEPPGQAGFNLPIKRHRVAGWMKTVSQYMLPPGD